MSSKNYIDKIEEGCHATHNTLGDVDVIGKIDHSGDIPLWVVEDSFGILQIVKEDDLGFFYYW